MSEFSKRTDHDAVFRPVQARFQVEFGIMPSIGIVSSAATHMLLPGGDALVNHAVDAGVKGVQALSREGVKKARYEVDGSDNNEIIDDATSNEDLYRISGFMESDLENIGEQYNKADAAMKTGCDRFAKQVSRGFAQRLTFNQVQTLLAHYYLETSQAKK